MALRFHRKETEDLIRLAGVAVRWGWGLGAHLSIFSSPTATPRGYRLGGKAGLDAPSPSTIGLGMQRCQRGCWRAALGWFILISTDEPAGPDLATVSQLRHTAQNPLQPEVGRRRRRRTLGGHWQEAVTQQKSPRPLKQRPLKRPVSFGYHRVICVSSISCTAQEVLP